MTPMMTSLVAFGFIFGGLMFGWFLRGVLPDHHLQDESKDAVKLGTGLIATLTALVLGLLISSAKNSFDAINSGLAQAGAKIITLDRLLAQYGPEAREARELLRGTIGRVLQRNWPEETAKLPGLEPTNLTATNPSTTASIEMLSDKLRQMAPASDGQRGLLAQAQQINGELVQLRWLIFEQGRGALPTPFLVVLVFWLTILFVSFGLFSPRNLMVICVLLLCAVSAAGALYLMLEMSNPMDGLMKVPSTPLLSAYELLGK